MEVVKYSANYKDAWDAFVATSKNGTFLLQRDYMEYHADRFEDHSLLFYRKGKLVALLPANVAGTEVQSHGGLSYGGIVSGAGMKAQLMLDVFDAMMLYYKQQGFETINYKTVPHIYHRHPAEEDLYAIFRNDALLYRRDLNTVISLRDRLPYNTLRKRKLNQASQQRIQFGLSQNFEEFITIQNELLQQKYNTSPAHTVSDIRLLASRFPDNIKLYAATQADKMLAAILIYETALVAHCQYIASTPEGRIAGALDALTNYLISQVYTSKDYFSFGVSTEQQGTYLNQNLILNKESYGGRAIAHDFYKLVLK
ncbi:GNAT family N-acetyltransferase [Pontibacter pudoricolor]|uniref:GNAT family N-acetyltransferase n=1 Tax=Pontibacter pudoricolor TaxID=2694930 RepID=UPI001390E3EB|nr:GNAT family N-acetyltransferase [Pontibacter pudoricolor]